MSTINPKNEERGREVRILGRVMGEELTHDELAQVNGGCGVSNILVAGTATDNGKTCDA